MKKQVISVYLLRHGETESNAQGLVQGHSDPGLTKNGITQITKVGKDLSKIEFDAFYTSPLKRATESANILRKVLKIDPLVLDALKEQSFGVLEGKPKEVLMRHFKEKEWDKMKFKDKRTFKIDPTAESDQEALDRLLSVIDELKTKNLNYTILILTHGTIMRHLLIDLGYATYEKQASISNAGFIHLVFKDRAWHLEDYAGIKFNN